MTRDRSSEGVQRRSRWIRPWRDWWMLAHAAVATIAIRAALTVWPLRRVSRGLKQAARRLPGPHTRGPKARDRARWAARAVGRRLLPRRPCLTQALVLQHLLYCHGDASATLHIGVMKGTSDELRAHAWLERDGKVLIGGKAAPDDYRPLEELHETIEAQIDREHLSD